MKMKTRYNVYELRKSGHRVRVIHRRRYLAVDKNVNTKVGTWSRQEFEKNKTAFVATRLLETGGTTTVEITLDDGDQLHGVAECSVNDGYNRRVGLSAALGRALTSKTHKLTPAPVKDE